MDSVWFNSSAVLAGESELARKIIYRWDEGTASTFCGSV